jgi:hypothetical protein
MFIILFWASHTLVGDSRYSVFLNKNQANKMNSVSRVTKYFYFRCNDIYWMVLAFELRNTEGIAANIIPHWSNVTFPRVDPEVVVLKLPKIEKKSGTIFSRAHHRWKQK